MNVIFLIHLIFVTSVHCKVSYKSLTESMGQEVIEIGAPLKELPPDLEEEPAAESDDIITSTTLQAATKNKPALSYGSDKSKVSNKIDRVKQEDDEARIEKELAEMYKDTDYKADSAEVTTRKDDPSNSSVASDVVASEDKEIGRARNKFKFQPDDSNANAIARFRTSVDEISCEKNQLSGSTIKSLLNSSARILIESSLSVIFIVIFLIC